MTPSPADAKPDFADRLLVWYDRHARELPWRIAPSAFKQCKADPYRVWLSEIMLQQTTVETVKPYFAKFTTFWPDVAALAAAADDAVMRAWAGLGYYSRARNLKACASAVMRDHHGRFPDDEAGLRALPGIGDYTAAAIAAIAFNRPAAVVDGNVERVVTRHRTIATLLPKAKTEVRDFLKGHVPGDRPGDFAQAMMDLGATVCTPKRPSCILCPLREDCRALGPGEDPLRYPVKAPKAERPIRQGATFAAFRGDGSVLLEKRPERGLLGGMVGLPTTDWTSRRDGATGALAAPFAANWKLTGHVTHVFTHFELRLEVWVADVQVHEPGDGRWWSGPREVWDEALPTVMKKALESAIQDEARRSAKGSS